MMFLTVLVEKRHLWW